MSELMGRVMRLLSFAACVALVGVAALPGRAAGWSPGREKRIGRRAAREIAKQYGVVEDREQLARLQHITEALAPVSDRPEVAYKLGILNLDTPNALAIPDGYIFVTRGLVDTVDSDDELAGVLAHEIAHNCLYHMMKQLDRYKKYRTINILALAATLLLGPQAMAVQEVEGPYGPRVAGATLADAVRLTTWGLLSHYSVEMEAEADECAVRYMYKSPYNPVGVLAAMERMARRARGDARYDPDISEHGIFQTHPASRWRALRVVEQLRALGVSVNREAVTRWSLARAIPAFVAGRPAAEVELFGRCVFAPVAVSPAGEDPLRRAARAAERLNQSIDEGLEPFEVGTSELEDRCLVVARGQPLFRIYPEDAEAHGRSVAVLADECADAVKCALIGQETGLQY
ncbi:MAG: M48 family metalloprotease [Armatimonadota bacterium]